MGFEEQQLGEIPLLSKIQCKDDPYIVGIVWVLQEYGIRSEKDLSTAHPRFLEEILPSEPSYRPFTPLTWAMAVREGIILNERLRRIHPSIDP